MKTNVSYRQGDLQWGGGSHGHGGDGGGGQKSEIMGVGSFGRWGFIGGYSVLVNRI